MRIASIKKRLSRPQSNIFLVNLSVTDLLSALLVMSGSLQALLADHWHLGKLACDVTCLLNYTLIIVSMMSMCFIALERYVAVMHALRYHRIVTRHRVRLF